MTTIIAYTYEADYHCENCTKKYFGDDSFTWMTTVDSEGNPVRPLFSTDEWQEFDEGFLAENPTQYLTCGDCHEVIEEYTHE